MDCRKALLGMALAIMTTSAGCQTFPLGNDPSNAAPSPNPQISPTLPGSAAPPAAPTVSEASKPKKAPSPATCVAVGQFLEREALSSAKASPLAKQQEFDKARRAYQEALRLNPNYLPAYSALAHLYVVLGDQDRALATYQKGLQKNAKEPSLWFDLGMFHARKKEFDAAITCLTKAVELDPENRHYSNTLGFCLARAGRIQDSVSLFSKSSGEAAAYYNVSRVLRDSNQPDLSRRYLQQAIALNPNFPEARQMLASLDAPGGNNIVTVGFQPR